jgi:signal transduction histidine kinase
MRSSAPHPRRLLRSLRTQVALGALGAAGLGAVCLGAWLTPGSPGLAASGPAEALRWLVSGAAGAGALGLAWASGRRAARPWADLVQALRLHDGEADSPLPAGGPEEVCAGVETLNAWIERRRLAAVRQQRLLGDASHQLRTPLAVLRTLLQGTPAPELAARQEEMLRTVDRATEVVNEMLARLKLDQRRAQAAPAATLRLDTAAREAALEFAPLIAAQRLHFELQAVPLAVQADAWMLGELVRNLLVNAIRHSPRGAALGIVVRAAHSGPELIVWDSGPGLGDGPRERLFEPFAAAVGGGIGLGLSICRELAQAMGAQVELYNRTDGLQAAGVDAVVRWPAAAACSPPPVTHPHEGDPPGRRYASP